MCWRGLISSFMIQITLNYCVASKHSRFIFGENYLTSLGYKNSIQQT